MRSRQIVASCLGGSKDRTCRAQPGGADGRLDDPQQPIVGDSPQELSFLAVGDPPILD